jgi:NurA-like 5'-3' nuclease
MTNTQQQIKDIETRWWRLVEQRQEHYNLVLNEVAKEYRMAVIEELNQSMDYEAKFDEMETELRALNPKHDFLKENQIPV